MVWPGSPAARDFPAGPRFDTLPAPYVPTGSGLADHLALAGKAGDVFRAATFYNDEPGAKVVCYGPSVQGGDSSSDDGNWFGVTVAIPFEFYFIA